MRKWICPGLVAALLAVAVGLVMKFVLLGQTVALADGRQAIKLTEPQRELVLSEMRGFLAGVQQITGAATREDMAVIARTARGLGMATARNMPGPLVGRLPGEFKQLGFSVHRDFDAIALEAESMGDTQVVLTHLSETLNKCVACHATYRITVESP